MLRHILGVETGTQLSGTEIDDFMAYAEELLQNTSTELKTATHQQKNALRYATKQNICLLMCKYFC